MRVHVLLVVLLLPSFVASAVEPKRIEGEWSLKDEGLSKAYSIIQLNIVDPSIDVSVDPRQYVRNPFYCDAAELASPDRYEIVATRNGAEQTPIPVRSVRLTRRVIELDAGDFEPQVGTEYRVVLREGSVEIGCDPAARSQTRERIAAGAVMVDDGNLATDLRYVRRSPESRFQLGGGNSGGTVTALIELPFEEIRFGDEGGYLFIGEFDVSADVTLLPGDQDEYFNRIDAKLDLGIAMLPEWLGRRFLEFSISGGIESDQTLDNADGVIEAGITVYAKNPLTEYLATKISPSETAPSPRLSVAYQFAIEAVSDAPPKPDTDGGAHRIDFLIDWRLPVHSGVDLTSIPALGSIYAIQFLFEGGGRYDFETKQFFDRTRLGVELRPVDQRGSLNATIMVWWEQGQAAPVFERFDAILAGIKTEF